MVVVQGGRGGVWGSRELLSDASLPPVVVVEGGRGGVWGSRELLSDASPPSAE